MKRKAFKSRNLRIQDRNGQAGIDNLRRDRGNYIDEFQKSSDIILIIINHNNFLVNDKLKSTFSRRKLIIKNKGISAKLNYILI